MPLPAREHVWQMLAFLRWKVTGEIDAGYAVTPEATRYIGGMMRSLA
jgi:hypothetical protein